MEDMHITKVIDRIDLVGPITFNDHHRLLIHGEDLYEKVYNMLRFAADIGSIHVSVITSREGVDTTAKKTP